MRALGIGALIVTVVSAMFHWHVMCNGALLVGRKSRPFREDMQQMPRLLLSFVTEPVHAALSRSRPTPAPAAAEEIVA
jgi:hypothetical protein